MYMKARTTYTLNYIDAVSFGGKKGAKRGRISNGIITYVSKCDNVPKLGLYRVHACVWVRAWVVLARARVSSHAFSTSLAVDSLAHIMENTRTPKQLATITATANCIHKATIILCVFRSGHLHPLHHLLPLVFSPYARIRVFVPYFCGFRFSFLFVFSFTFVRWCIYAPVCGIFSTIPSLCLSHWLFLQFFPFLSEYPTIRITYACAQPLHTYINE